MVSAGARRNCRKTALRAPRFLALLMAAAALLASAQLSRGQGAVEEYQLKAAFLFNFTRYVNWPEAPPSAADEPFVIGVLGDDPFGHWLEEAVSGREVGGRRAVARRYARPEDARECRVLFVAVRDPAGLERAIGVVANRPVLTVGEGDAFLEAGGMISFATEGRRVRFDVNLPAAKRAGLAPGSQLLKLARTVKGAAHGR
jgi:hypothetical protein